MKTTLISIIIPVYKAEKYLHRCLDSIIGQTYTDWECILVDDGSPDGCPEICDNYLQRDSRFRVIHKKNEGVSIARQTGLDNAIGEYVIHVDPDDWIEPEMLNDLYEKITLDNADVLICDYYVHLGDNVTYIRQEPSSFEKDQLLCDYTLKLQGFCWNKLVKRAIFTQFDIKFPKNISYCEDLYVNILLVKNGATISYLNKAYYHYIKNQNANSLSSPVNGSFFQDKCMFDLFVEALKGTRAEREFTKVFSSRIILRNFWRKKDSGLQFVKNCFPLLKYVRIGGSLKGYLMILFSCLGFYPILRRIHNIVN